MFLGHLFWNILERNDILLSWNGKSNKTQTAIQLKNAFT